MESIIFLTLNLILFFFFFASFIFRFEYDFVFLGFTAIFALFLAFNISSVGISNDCDLVLTQTRETYVYGSNFTAYHWDYDYGDPDDDEEDELTPFLFHKNTTNTYDNVCSNENTFATNFLRLIYVIFAMGMIGLAIVRIMEAMER